MWIYMFKRRYAGVFTILQNATQHSTERCGHSYTHPTPAHTLTRYPYPTQHQRSIYQMPKTPGMPLLLPCSFPLSVLLPPSLFPLTPLLLPSYSPLTPLLLPSYPSLCLPTGSRPGFSNRHRSSSCSCAGIHRTPDPGSDSDSDSPGSQRAAFSNVSSSSGYVVGGWKSVAACERMCGSIGGM